MPESQHLRNNGWLRFGSPNHGLDKPAPVSTDVKHPRAERRRASNIEFTNQSYTIYTGQEPSARCPLAKLPSATGLLPAASNLETAVHAPSPCNSFCRKLRCATAAAQVTWTRMPWEAQEQCLFGDTCHTTLPCICCMPKLEANPGFSELVSESV